MRTYEVDVIYTEPGGDPMHAAVAVEAGSEGDARDGARAACLADPYHPAQFESFTVGEVRRMDLGPAVPVPEEIA